MGRRAGRTMWCAVAAAALFACATSADGEGAAAPPDGDAPDATRSADQAAAVAVVEDYVEALRDGDVAAAVDLRCRGSRPDERELGWFASNLDTLQDELGSLDSVEARTIEPEPGLLDDLVDPVVVAYRIVFDGEPRAERYLATAMEDGERRLCLGATGPPDDPLGDPLELVPGADAPDLDALMPDAARPGEILRDDRTRSADEVPEPADGLVTVRDRAWSSPDETSGSRVTADRYATPDQALAAARSRMREFGPDASSTFTVPGVPGAVGYRIGAWSWLWVQPPGEGSHVEYVTIVYGATRVEIGVSMVGPDHSAIEALARDVHARATGAPLG